MALKAQRFVGLDRDVYLPDDIEVIIRIIPDSMIGWVRSGYRNAPNYSTWHDTGNSGADALHEANYLHGGPRDQNGNPYQVGYNFAVDDRRIVQLTPLNEDTWAAGTATGNHTSWHTEQCFGGSINWDKSLRNTAALHGGLIAAMPGWELVPSLVQHNVWYGKDCPGQIRHRGLWPQAVAKATEFFNAARIAAAGKETAETVPVYKTPAKPPFFDAIQAAPFVDDANGFRWFRAENLYRVKVDAVDRDQYAYDGSPDVGPKLRKGETFRSFAIGTAGDGSAWVITPFLTRVKMSALEFLSNE